MGDRVDCMSGMEKQSVVGGVMGDGRCDGVGR